MADETTPKAPLKRVDTPAALTAGALRRVTEPASLPGDVTRAHDGYVGQARAIEAIRFGAEIERPGFNLFVLGPRGSGRRSAVAAVLEKKAPNEPTPDDWVYVNNFAAPHKPRAMRLPVGTAP